MKAGNRDYPNPASLPEVIPVFPLPAALLLPHAEMPLNIFEPRYLAMVDHALRGDRIIGMIQPEPDRTELCAVGCAGRITQLAETGDGRYLVTLTGVARFHVVEELHTDTSFRQCRVSAAAFTGDFDAPDDRSVDRETVLHAFREYLDLNNLKADWDSVERATNEVLVNALAMMAPFGPAEKQALLEAPDLRTRAETLVALTELAMAREGGDGRPLQ